MDCLAALLHMVTLMQSFALLCCLSSTVAFALYVEICSRLLLSQCSCSGPFNPCYCCIRLCYNNGGSFIDANDSLLLPVHDRELSNVVHNSCNSVWICSRCKSSLKKHKLPSFASVNDMCVPPVLSELSCLNSIEN